MNPYWREPGVSLYCGNAIEVLRNLPDASAHCCVTSPPYWGLRDYGIPGCVWGGDPSHSHEWTSEVRHRSAGGPQVAQTKWKTNTSVVVAQRDTCSAFCECGAWLGALGLEPTPGLYVAHVTDVFREVRRVLRGDGTLWLNLGDSYANDGKWGGSTSGKHVASLHGDSIGRSRRTSGLKPKDLVGIPWRVAFALQADGWYLRSDIIWSKPNAMPESIADRPTKAHEYLFLLAKSEKYFYDADKISEPSVSDHGSGNGFKRDARLSYMDDDGPRGNEKPWTPNGKPASRDNFARDTKEADAPGSSCRQHRIDRLPTFATGTRNRRSVWTINTAPYPEAHFATFPEDLVRPCILAGCPQGGRVLDPFVGSGTTLAVAEALGCEGDGIDLNPEYLELAKKRLGQCHLPLGPDDQPVLHPEAIADRI